MRPPRHRARGEATLFLNSSEEPATSAGRSLRAASKSLLSAPKVALFPAGMKPIYSSDALKIRKPAQRTTVLRASPIAGQYFERASGSMCGMQKIGLSTDFRWHSISLSTHVVNLRQDA